MRKIPKILAFAGSLRAKSWNKMLAKIAAEGAEKAGADVTFIDLADLPMPIFDQDIEEKDGMDPNGQKFKDLLTESDGIIISSPEYNSSISAALKNAIDWASRTSTGDAPLSAFNDKIAVIMSTSPGGLGGLRGLVHLRSILGNINVTVLPEQKAIPAAHEKFSEDGKLKDSKLKTEIETIAAKLVAVCSKLT